jgi:hypothetical protein
MARHEAAGFSVSESGLPWRSVPNGDSPRTWFSHMSIPPSAMPAGPYRDQSGFTLRTRFKSRPIAEPRQAPS